MCFFFIVLSTVLVLDLLGSLSFVKHTLTHKLQIQVERIANPFFLVYSDFFSAKSET